MARAEMRKASQMPDSPVPANIAQRLFLSGQVKFYFKCSVCLPSNRFNRELVKLVKIQVRMQRQNDAMEAVQKYNEEQRKKVASITQ